MENKVVKTKITSSKSDISATIHYSKSKTNRLAVLCPGYLDSKDYTHLVRLAEALCEEGYTAVRFDPTGTWESEGDISDYTTTQYLEDIRSVIDYMVKESEYNHILLGGHSRGGQVSIIYAARDSRVSIVLGIMPSHGPTTGQRREEWEKTGVSVSQRDLPEDRNKTIEFKVPVKHMLDRDRHDALADAKKIKVPIILIAGELDDLVLPEEVKEIFDNSNEPKKFMIIKGIEHDYRYNNDEISIVNEKILKLLNSVQGIKTILVDAVDAFVIEEKGSFKIFNEMYDLLEKFPNRKIILTGANDEQFKKFGLDKMPYEVFTLKHNPEKTDPKYFEMMLKHFGLNNKEVIYFEHNPSAVKSAESIGIKSYYYDPDKKDLEALKKFLDENSS